MLISVEFYQEEITLDLKGETSRKIGSADNPERLKLKVWDYEKYERSIEIRAEAL